jgi:hypothetical protein
MGKDWKEKLGDGKLEAGAGALVALGLSDHSATQM